MPEPVSVISSVSNLLAIFRSMETAQRILSFFGAPVFLQNDHRVKERCCDIVVKALANLCPTESFDVSGRYRRNGRKLRIYIRIAHQKKLPITQVSFIREQVYGLLNSHWISCELKFEDSFEAT